MRNRITVAFITALVAFQTVGSARADALSKLQPDKLEAVRKDIAALRSIWQKLPRTGPYTEYRANLHVHSAFSHDSRGTLDELIAAAKATGTRVLCFTEHPAAHYDYFRDGHQGTKEGILLIPGAETGGFLVFPTRSLPARTTETPQEFADLARGRGSLLFLSHLEERMDWDLRGLTGVEIYNTHADFKDEKKLLAAMRNPLWLWKSVDLFRQYPQESFSALLDYPADYLRRWDELCVKAPHTGVAANDAHQNIGLVVKLAAGDKAHFEDALGKKLYETDCSAIPQLESVRKNKKAGDVLFQLRLDPYENSLRHVGTHLLLTELSAKAVREALEAGRAFVAFDWLGDATGFDFAVQSPSSRYEMGSQCTFQEGLKVQARSPVSGQWRLLRDGQLVSQGEGRSLDVPITKPGVYRVEVWLKIAGEETIWILSNPIYVRGAAKG